MAIVPSRPPIARIAPTDRSMPPDMMISVMPSAMMLITAVWRTTLDRFVFVKKVRRRDRQSDEQRCQSDERQQPLNHVVRSLQARRGA